MRHIPRAIAILCFAALFAQASEHDVERIRKGKLLIEGVPEIPESVIDRMRQYQNMRSASVSDWYPDGSGMLVSTRFAETSQLHRIDQPGGARRQLTFFDEPVRGSTICPDPSRQGFLFGKDVGGSEFYQIFWFDSATGDSTMLTDGTSRNGSALWSNKGDKFAYNSTRRNGRDYDIYINDINQPKVPKLIAKNSGMWSPVDWSPDDRQLLVSNYISINESYVYILDIASGRLEQVNPSDEKIAYGAAVWSKDGGGVYFTSDEDSEFRRLRYYSVADKSITDLTAAISWDVGDVELSKQGSHLAFTANEDGVGKLYVLDTASMEYAPAAGIPLGQVNNLHFDPAGERLAMVINTAQTPGDIYVLTLADGSLERWTYSEVGGLNTDSFVVPDLIHYDTFVEMDKPALAIPAFYYKPAKGEGPFPVVITIHGGPEGQYRPYFSGRFQYWINELGIAVLAPNVRGSRGYGKSYLKLDNWEKREDSVRDIGALLDWVEKQPELDASRVAVYGGSYGGYMVLASMIHFNERLKAGIESVGISNFVTFLENTKEYRRDLRRVEYGDERDPDMREFLQGISPTTNAHKITKPMLIAQGLNDPRVPAGESEQIVEAIRKNGGTAWYILAEDEGHGLSKKSNRDYYSHAVTLFLEEFLLK